MNHYLSQICHKPGFVILSIFGHLHSSDTNQHASHFKHKLGWSQFISSDHIKKDFFLIYFILTFLFFFSFSMYVVLTWVLVIFSCKREGDNTHSNTWTLQLSQPSMMGSKVIYMSSVGSKIGVLWMGVELPWWKSVSSEATLVHKGFV